MSESKPLPRFFISYCVDDSKFVHDVCRLLEPYLQQANMFLFQKRPQLEGDFLAGIETEIERSDCLIAFVGKRFDLYQAIEAGWANARPLEDRDRSGHKRAIMFVAIGGQRSPAEFPRIITTHFGGRHLIFDEFSRTEAALGRFPADAVACAQAILRDLETWGASKWGANYQWTDKHLMYGLPRTPQLFDYEKNIIEFYAAKRFYEKQLTAETEAEKNAIELQRPRLTTALSRWPADKIEPTLHDGVPGEWPNVYRYPHTRDNHLAEEIAGSRREDDVLAASLVRLDAPGEPLTFPEAGPREKIALPIPGDNELKVAILVAGGIAPGINAVIDAIVQRHHAYHSARGQEGYNLIIVGIQNGFLAFVPNQLHSHLQNLSKKDTIEFATRGGSMLGTSRDDELLQLPTRRERLREIVAALKRENIDVLYIIGGDGSMKAAHAIWNWANMDSNGHRMSVIAIPKTMDNDILWVWQSFGFLSAVDESRRIVETLHTEVRSNPRLGIVQLFGSDSGFVVSHAVLAAAAGHTTLALIPEIHFSAIGVARYLKWRLWDSANPNPNPDGPPRPIDSKYAHGLVVMAETAIPEDALECLGIAMDHLPEDYADEYRHIAAKLHPTLSRDEVDEIRRFFERRSRNQRSEGQTSEILRQLGLRILKEALPVFIASRRLKVEGHGRPQPGFPAPDWKKLRIVCSEPRHLVRSLEPSTSDIITGQRLGLLAVDAAMAGYTDCMVSQWLTEFALVPLELVVLGRKRIPAEGMFWKSVISKTGQWPGTELVEPYHPRVAY